jgi:hypothetical protein
MLIQLKRHDSINDEVTGLPPTKGAMRVYSSGGSNVFRCYHLLIG